MIAKLDSKDALTTDNSAISILPQRAPLPITLVTTGSLFLKIVLESMPLVELTITETAPDAASKGGLLVIDRKIPARLPRGRVLIVDPQNNTDFWTVGETLEQPLVARVEKDSPLTQHIRLDNVLFPGAKQLTFTGPVESLIRDPLDSPLLARMKRPGGDLWLLTCNLEQSDLPLRIAFPVLIKNAIEWFQGNEGQLRPVVPTGSLATFSIPEAVDLAGLAKQDAAPDQPIAAKNPEASQIENNSESAVAVESTAAHPARRALQVSSPSGKNTTLSAQGENALIGPILECGLWTVAPASESKSSETAPASVAKDKGKTDYRWTFASNLTNRRESDWKPRGNLLTADSLSVVSLGGRSIWFYLALISLVLVTTEWWLYQRRVVG